MEGHALSCPIFVQSWALAAKAFASGQARRLGNLPLRAAASTAIDFPARVNYNAETMAMINVNRGATSLGIFSEEDVLAGLRAGRFAPTDLGWREGMTSWQPLAQFPEFASETAAAVAAQGAPTTAITSSQVATETPITRTGLPWENRQERGFVNAFTETLVMVLTKPVEAFQIMRTEGGFGDPLLYALIGGSLGFIVYCLLTIALQSVGMFASRNNPFAAMFGAGVGMVFFIILAPLFVAVTVFIAAAVMHLCLMLVGGAKKSFETTFRVICFATGSAQPLLIIPFCGGLISGIWGIVVECIGLAQAHETDTGRAVLAVLLPVIVCCGGALVLGVMFGVMGALSAQH